ncbi:hypothetical protein NB550_03490, partial [Vibrio parahaemolyticus]
MSMYISVSKFKEKDGRLNADYSTISKEVVVTEFLDSLISEKYISYFTAFEDDEELEYREITKECIIEMSKEIDNIADGLFSELKNTSGKSKREEIILKIRDVNL